MQEEIKNLHKELQEIKKEKDAIDKIYEEKKAELHLLINGHVGNGHEQFIDVPDSVPLSAEAIRNHVTNQYPEGTITNIDFEKRLVRIFIPAEYQRFVYEDENGKIERRINKGKSYLDLDLLYIIDQDLWKKVTKSEFVLDEIALEKAIAEDESIIESVKSAIKTSKPKTALYLTEKEEK